MSSAIVGVGVDVEAFVREFSQWGQVVIPGADKDGASMAVSSAREQE